MEASTSKSAAFEAGTAIVSKASFPGDLPESAKAYQMRGSAESGQADKQVKAGEFGMKLDPALSLESFSTGREALFKMPGSNAAANATSTGRLLDASEFFTGRVVPAQVAPVPQISPEILAARAVGRAVEAGRGQLLDQVVQGVRVAHQGEAIEITVHLRPDFLGRLSIRVLADDAGMRVEIRAENEVVRQLMQDNMADLQQRLSEKGLSFDSFGVFAEAGQNQRDGPEYSFRAQTRDGPEAQQGAAETASEQASGPIPIQGGAMIDCFA
jgi:flagellar hook-length control protein FliK